MNLNQAIYQLNPIIKIIRGEDAFDVEGNPVAYDKAEAEKLVAANLYKEKRAAEYPSFADQFDLLYHGGYEAWKSAIQTVKDKYPKT